MRKTLVAVAAALAFGSLSAHAGDVQMYGLIDVGLSYVHSDADQPGVDSVDKFTMENASEFGSRWGIRGTEDLGNGMKVSFVLENGFSADTGALSTLQRDVGSHSRTRKCAKNGESSKCLFHFSEPLMSNEVSCSRGSSRSFVRRRSFYLGLSSLFREQVFPRNFFSLRTLVNND